MVVKGSLRWGIVYGTVNCMVDGGGGWWWGKLRNKNKTYYVTKLAS